MARIFGIDLRTLALFRICLGAVILADLVNRAGFLTVFYTDQGVLTRAAAIDFNHPARISFHLMSGSPLVIGLLFGIAGLLALLLMLGYRNRWRKYLSRLPDKRYPGQVKNFARYYCRTYNRFDRGPVRLASFTIDYHRERTLPDYQPPEYKVIRLLNWNCLPKGDG